VTIEAIKVPMLAESVAEATLLNWYKQPGETVQEGDKLVDIETDKVVLEVVAPKAGTLTKILKNSRETVLSEEIIGQLDTAAIPASPPPPPTSAEVKTSPAVRKMASEQQLDLTKVPHAGDRITKADLLGLQESLKVPPPEPTTPSTRPEQRVAMTRLRKRIAERLLQAQREHAILTTFNEINMKAVMDVRNKYKETFEKRHHIKLGFMSFFTKAAVAALQKFPIINASTHEEDIIYHGYYDIGIAVGSPRGLVVPILRDADIRSLAEIEKRIADFGKRAQVGELTLEELTGGTFTITNGGIFGSMLSTPILNPPQSAILGMHNIVERPIAENGQVVIRPIMYVALSYDHRIVDGRDAVQFLFAIKQFIEDPVRLLLEI